MAQHLGHQSTTQVVFIFPFTDSFLFLSSEQHTRTHAFSINRRVHMQKQPSSSSSRSSHASPIPPCRPRRQSVSIAAAASANRKDDSYLTAGTSLTPWKSADSLISTSHDQSSSSSRKKDVHHLFTDNVPWSITQRLRKFSLSRPTSASSSSKQPTTPTVVETHTINKDYDPTTGNKILNNKYMIVREIGRGVHGKVKLAEDIESHDLVVCNVIIQQVKWFINIDVIGYQDC